jgi:hypothetical protein
MVDVTTIHPIKCGWLIQEAIHFSFFFLSTTQVRTPCNDKIKNESFLDLEFLATQLSLVSQPSTTQPCQ